MEEESCLSSLNIQELQTVLQKSYSTCDGLIDVPACLGEDLQNELQRRNDLKAEYLTVIEEKLLQNEFQKQPDQWLTFRIAESQLSASKEISSQAKSILGARLGNIQESVTVASDALETLREKADILAEKICKLQEKIKAELQKEKSLTSKTPHLGSENGPQSGEKVSKKEYKSLSGLPLTNIQNVESKSDLTYKARKVSELLTSSRAERDIIMGRMHRMQALLTHFEEANSSLLKKETASRNELTRLNEKLKDLEQFAGVKCHIKDNNTLEVDFLSGEAFSEKQVEDSGGSGTPDETRFTVTLIFSENEQKHLVLKEVQTNRLKKEAETLIKNAKLDNDIPALITSLEKLWKTHVPLVSEISQIRCRHAVDWIEEKRLLLLMIRKNSNIVCALKVPPHYPSSGQIQLESIIGHSSHLGPEDIQPPVINSLKGWIQHLEQVFSPL